ncbi:MAG: YgiQ family radical SAM protein, partial [Candidatus Woesearchaeota archaeon]|nr:YgiQ family radical SAM protein [Candidatus Woesearchaeota archaeon]
MISLKKEDSQFDVILITGEGYDDHPLSPAGIIARVLDAKGFSVGIIEKPEKKEDFTRLGAPNLFFGITSGSIDSMLNNYTPLKKRRNEDVHNKNSLMPDRAVVVYCNKVREYFRGAKIVIGGIEASLRRFAHYDYWDNNIRRSILLDSRADILVYGNGEKQTLEIAEKIKSGKDLKGILGTCILSKEMPSGFIGLPSFQEITDSKEKFCEMQVKFSNYMNICQKYDNNYVLQYQFPDYTSDDLDWIYSLPYSRKLSPNSLLKLAQFSLITHRGCIGNCNFCSIALHQGTKIISRSEESILSEIKRITKHPEFKGYIDDLGGPSANMYGLDIESRNASCDKIEASHKRIIELLRKAREIPGVKKIFIRS